MLDKEAMKQILSSRTLTGVYILLLLLSAAINSRACGTSTSTVTNLPALPESGFQVFGLNATGQLTGFFFVAFEHGGHAFLYDSGSLSDLGTFGGGTSSGNAINSSGQIAGQSDLATPGQTHAFLYSGGQVLDLGTLGGPTSSADALNDAGQVIGTSTLSSNASTVGFLYANGAMTSLGTFGGDSYPFALNNAGVVVGESSLTNGDFHGFVYAGGTLTDVGTLGSNYSAAFAVNDAGVVVGESLTASGENHGVVYSGGALTDVGTLGGTYSSAYGINSSGQVMGLANTANDQETHGFLYNGGALTDLGTLGGNFSAPTAINNRGEVVGESLTTNGVYHAFLYRDGQMVDLNTLLPTNSGWELQSAQFINDANRIVGFGTYNQLSQWFILDVVPANHPPVAVAGSDQTVDCAAQVTLDGSQSSDPDNDLLTFEWSLGGSVLGTNVTLATSLPLGTNVVTLTVTDSCGASSQATITVRVVDTTPPTISCPAAITASSDANCQAAVPDFLSQLFVIDNCAPRQLLTLSQSPGSGTLVGLGPHPVTVTVTDPSGNTTNCTTLFTVADTTSPVIVSTPAPLTVSAAANCQGVVPNVLGNIVATDNCTPANQLAITQSPAAGTPLGTGAHIITVTVADAAGNSSTANVSVTVADTTAPSILNTPGPITISADAHCQAAVPNVLPNVAAADNCTPANQLAMSQSPAAGTVVGTGQYTITVTVTDAAGNNSTTNVPLTVADTTAPAILGVPASLGVSVGADCQGAVPNVVTNVVATDNCTPTNQLVIAQNPAAGSLLGPGQYTIAVTVTDASGNSSMTNVLLTVADTTVPAIVSLPAPLVVPVGANCQGAVPNILPNIVATDNCTPANQLVMTQSPAAGTLLGTGQYTITLKVADASGNTTTAAVSLTLADTTPPAILSLPAPLAVHANAQCQGTVPNVLSNVVASDNCTPAAQLIVAQSPAAGTIVGTGPHPITVTVTDAAGNTSTGTVAFEVFETVRPIIVSKPGPITLSAGANGQAAVPDVLPGVSATDNCTPADQLVLAQSPSAGALLGPGRYKIDVTVTDLSGNSATSTVTLKVVDTTPPVIVSAPGPLTVQVDANCQGTVPDVLAAVVATDNCTPASQLVMTQKPAAGTTLRIGSHTISFTVTDAAGNKSTGSVAFNVVDITPPAIVSAPGPITLSADANGQAAVPNVLPNIVAQDNCTPGNRLVKTQSPAAGTLLPPGQYTISVMVSDASGNSSATAVSLTIADTTAPVIHSLTANPNVLSPPSGSMVPVTISASVSDNCDPAPVTKIISVSSSAPTAPGDIQITGNLTLSLAANKGPGGTARVYTVTVQSTDASGNHATGMVKVTVPRK
ncbi:MAG TPA: HYR domain-containing protein [Candidatus Binatia bacterium]|jgi:probable HAF family extracellular repeat protein|nr:HYR domain-containing protein [Candidatus Binatia bacterium]